MNCAIVYLEKIMTHMQNYRRDTFYVRKVSSSVYLYHLIIARIKRRNKWDKAGSDIRELTTPAACERATLMMAILSRCRVKGGRGSAMLSRHARASR